MDEEHKDKEPQILFDDQFAIPDYLNPHLASVSLRALNNSPDDGYGLAVTAHVEPERVEIDVENGQVSFEMRIHKFEIRLKEANSTLDYGADYEALTLEQNRRKSIEQNTSSNSSRKIEADGELGAKLRAGIGVAARREQQNNEKYKYVQADKREFSHPALRIISAKSTNSKECLSGAVVANYKGWNVKANNTEKASGVFAQLRVRREWIQIKDVKIEGESPRINSLKDVWKKIVEYDEEKRRAFESLIQHLIAKGYQDKDERKYAALAADAIVARPKEWFEHLSAVECRDVIQVDLDLFERFIRLETTEDRKRFIENDDNLTVKKVHRTEKSAEIIPKELNALLSEMKAILIVLDADLEELFVSDTYKETFGKKCFVDLAEIFDLHSPIFTEAMSRWRTGTLGDSGGSFIIGPNSYPWHSSALELAVEGQSLGCHIVVITMQWPPEFMQRLSSIEIKRSKGFKSGHIVDINRESGYSSENIEISNPKFVNRNLSSNFVRIRIVHDLAVAELRKSMDFV